MPTIAICRASCRFLSCPLSPSVVTVNRARCYQLLHVSLFIAQDVAVAVCLSWPLTPSVCRNRCHRLSVVADVLRAVVLYRARLSVMPVFADCRDCYRRQLRTLPLSIVRAVAVCLSWPLSLTVMPAVAACLARCRRLSCTLSIMRALSLYIVPTIVHIK